MRLDVRRAAPTLIAGAIALAYVVISPPSYDLAAHLFRAKLFSAEGFGLWNNWWYGGHHTLGYSVLFPPLAAALTPQLVGAVATTVTAALFEPLAHREFGERSWLGACWFGAGTAVDLFSGRLTFAFGLMFAVAAVLALQRGRAPSAAALSALAALSSPVAALFTALVGAAYGLGGYLAKRERRDPVIGVGMIGASLLPVLALAVAFPEGGTEPYALSALLPLPVIGVLAVVLFPRRELPLKLGIAMYTVGCVASYAIPSPIGSNVGRLGTLLAGPLAALFWWRRRTLWLLVAVIPLLYLQWQAPIRDLTTSEDNATVFAAYWRPLIGFLDRQDGPPFRIEIPFTSFHWEAYWVAPHFPLARGWERQLDIKDNHLFYAGRLTAASYHAWLRRLAVRFVALTDTAPDVSARQEVRMIDRGLPYLRLVFRTTSFRVYAVRDALPIVQGPATLTALGPNSLTLRARRAGRLLLRVRFTPYWKLGEGSGCVAPDGDFTRLTLRRPGPAKLVVDFSLARIGSRAPRCT
ncbi:MAG: hypothetical protein M3Z06_06420 [Actinomycetota bacterium]|nr:hypothetical protein [Actinomycetota bacterium]